MKSALSSPADHSVDIIPAIDFKDGKVVNLKQGQPEQCTIYSEDPVGMAAHWVQAGAERLHLVDLDGAYAGKPVNAEAIRRIAQNHPHLSIQLGGGIRSPEVIAAYLDAGVDYLIIGTQAVVEPDFIGAICGRFPGKIMVGIDGYEGKVAIHGWQQVTDIKVEDLARQCEAAAVQAIIYTDISKDGMLEGLNLSATRDLAAMVQVPVIASGGVAGIEDIQALLELGSQIRGIITGRALYEGRLDLTEAIALTRAA